MVVAGPSKMPKNFPIHPIMTLILQKEIEKMNFCDSRTNDLGQFGRY